MIRKLLPLAVAIILTCACIAPEDIAQTSSPLFVDASEAGFGPFAVTGNVPNWGYIDYWNATTSQRMRGDIETGSGHLGRIVVPTISGVNWALKSPQYTYVIACAQMPTRSDYAACSGQTPAPFGVTAAGGYLPFTPAAFVVGYTPPCPSTPGMTTVHQCTGSYTPYDGSTIATAVVADGFPKPGLPYGSPLKMPTGSSGPFDVECVVDLSTYGLQSQFTRPPGYTLGWSALAVYTCP